MSGHWPAMRRSLSAMTEEIVLYTTENKIATIALNQPDSRNALSDALLDALIAAFERDARDGLLSRRRPWRLR